MIRSGSASGNANGSGPFFKPIAGFDFFFFAKRFVTNDLGRNDAIGAIDVISWRNGLKSVLLMLEPLWARL